MKLGMYPSKPVLVNFTDRLTNLKASGKIEEDPDYGKFGILRNMTIPDMPAEDIACLADPTAYISHLSAMQRWGLTDRAPRDLMLTQLDRRASKLILEDKMGPASLTDFSDAPKLKFVQHPHLVRGRRLHVIASDIQGKSVLSRGTFTRVATIGQTFLDMMKHPNLCGGMSHILDIWGEYAKAYLDDIIETIDLIGGNLAKSRAGYVLEERLRLKNPMVEEWKKTCLVGPNRKLDPSKTTHQSYSSAWNLSTDV
jgi:predicted transcriptional regulator of viral defense system